MKTDTLNRLHTLLAELHTDDTSTSSVWKVWNDGEITLEKGAIVATRGDAYRVRSAILEILQS